jgi:signal transduction histidine kinase/HAMP domain-containing protein
MNKSRLLSGSLAWRLGSAFTLIVLLVGIISIYRQYRDSDHTLRKLVQQRAEAELRQAASLLKHNLFSEGVQRLNFIAESNAMDRYYSLGETGRLIAKMEMERLLSRLQRNNFKIFHSIRFLENNGNESLGIVGKKRLRVLRRFSEYGEDRQLSSQIDDLFVKIKQHPLSQAVYSEPFQGDDKQWWLLIGMGVMDAEGHTLGSVLVLQACLGPFFNQLRKLDILGSNPAWVFDANDRIILKPSDSQLRANPLTEPQQALVIVSEGIGLETNSRPAMRLYISVPQKLFRTLISKQIIENAVAFGAIILLVLGLSGWLAYRFSVPIASLARATQRITAGELDARAVPAGSTEVRQLADDFNKMIDDLLARENKLRSSQAELKAAELKLKSVISGAQAVLWAIDSQGRFTLAEGRALENISLATNAAVGDSAFELFKDYPEILADIRSALQGGAVTALQHLPNFVLETRMTPLWDKDNQVAGIIGVSVDVTDRVRAERELEQYREQLEEMVAERTKELETAQEQLLKRERLATLGQLTASVSHELRNPLGVVRTSVYYLERKLKDSDKKIAKHLTRIDAQVSICDTIVDDLLEYTRGRHSERVKSEINPWLRQLLADFGETSGINVGCRLTADDIIVSFDREKMRRVVINLVTNAIQAVTAKKEHAKKEGYQYQPDVCISTRSNQDGVIMEVIDNGIGMDEETAKRVFEPLFTTRARGTGLGLAIVDKIISEHGGKVTLESSPHRGTSARVILPIEERS